MARNQGRHLCRNYEYNIKIKIYKMEKVDYRMWVGCVAAGRLR